MAASKERAQEGARDKIAAEVAKLTSARGRCGRKRTAQGGVMPISVQHPYPKGNRSALFGLVANRREPIQEVRPRGLGRITIEPLPFAKGAILAQQIARLAGGAF